MNLRKPVRFNRAQSKKITSIQENISMPSMLVQPLGVRRRIMGRYAITIVLLLFAGLSSAHASPLVIAVEDAAGPWSDKNGTGYANDVVTEAFRASGIAVIFKVVPYARCKHLTVSGEVVACFSMSPEPGLDEFVSLSDKPLFVVQFDYFQNRKRPLQAKREKDLPPGTIVGIVIDYEYPKSAMKLKEKGVVFQTAGDEETNLKKLALGRIDAAIINHNETKSVTDMIDKAGATGVVEFAFRSGRMGSYIGFSKKNPQGESARKKFNQGYQAIRKNGQLKRISAKWAAASRSHTDQ